MKSFLKDSEEITFIEKAELGILDDRLEVAEIATLAFPYDQRLSRAVETGMIKAIDNEELGYCRRVPLISPGEWDEDMAEELEESTSNI